MMTLSEKIVAERKKRGWSQEDLSEKLDVSRQSISKWESGQCYPDLPKIVLMSSLFGVSTDYLLKDGREETGDSAEGEDGDEERATPTPRILTTSFAERFLSYKEKAALPVALGVFLLILSPILLIFLSAVSESGRISEGAAVGFGISALFVLIAAAVAIFIIWDIRGAEFEGIENERTECLREAAALAKDRKNAFLPCYTPMLAIGVLLCVLSPLPLIIAAVAGASDFLIVTMVCLLLFVVAIGVFLLVYAADRMSGYDIMLKEGEYVDAGSEKRKKEEAIRTCYWLVVTAAYLLWSFLSKAWSLTWMVWPIAAVIFGAVTAIIKYKSYKNS